MAPPHPVDAVRLRNARGKVVETSIELCASDDRAELERAREALEAVGCQVYVYDDLPATQELLERAVARVGDFLAAHLPSVKLGFLSDLTESMHARASRVAQGVAELRAQREQAAEERAEDDVHTKRRRQVALAGALALGVGLVVAVVVVALPARSRRTSENHAATAAANTPGMPRLPPGAGGAEGPSDGTGATGSGAPRPPVRGGVPQGGAQVLDDLPETPARSGRNVEALWLAGSFALGFVVTALTQRARGPQSPTRRKDRKRTIAVGALALAAAVAAGVIRFPRRRAPTARSDTHTEAETHAFSRWAQALVRRPSSSRSGSRTFAELLQELRGMRAPAAPNTAAAGARAGAATRSHARHASHGRHHSRRHHGAREATHAGAQNLPRPNGTPPPATRATTDAGSVRSDRDDASVATPSSRAESPRALDAGEAPLTSPTEDGGSASSEDASSDASVTVARDGAPSDARASGARPEDASVPLRDDARVAERSAVDASARTPAGGATTAAANEGAGNESSDAGEGDGATPAAANPTGGETSGEPPPETSPTAQPGEAAGGGARAAQAAPPGASSRTSGAEAKRDPKRDVARRLSALLVGALVGLFVPRRRKLTMEDVT